MEVLSSRILLRPRDRDRSTAFYREVLGLAIHREFPGGTVFLLGGGYLEVSGEASREVSHSPSGAPPEEPSGRSGVLGGGSGPATAVWLQVRDLAATAATLIERRVEVLREPRREPWGLDEMWIADPDGLRLVLVEVPADHPMRKDCRPAGDP